MLEENGIREIKAKGSETEDAVDFGDSMQSSLYSFNFMFFAGLVLGGVLEEQKRG